ncbi:preprotein translocase subunit SecE [Spiroplasma monobiae]|uniref:Preprotein translocase subunit SecE n=1 Tax=Spiroplasma monobiae MQ-1 TaxID=1336748 RepID=A0A2K9LT73_SPISQ|nr:preprotein translocase subunit SecE [Spiroplasma monobiae]AUM62286.1 preprotein translocase subunit SecE [Spiroplasma monobiae MQ-1]
MSDKKDLREQKAQDKLNKIKEKQAQKEAKKETKKNKKEEFTKLYNEFEGHDGTQEGKIKAAKNKRVKKEKEKIDYKLALKEAPVKFLKEVNKIQWSSRKNLGTKFLWVIIFIAIFGVFFFCVDLAFQNLFELIRII